MISPADSDAIFKKLERHNDLPTLPAMAFEVIRLLKDEDTTIRQVAGVIEKDQAIVPRILKLVNSAFFGLKSRVTSISHAVIVLGFNTVRSALIALTVIDALPKGLTARGFRAADFWIHALSVATVSRHLIQHSHLAPTEDAFTAGLLHDIGKVVVLRYFPQSFEQIWATAQDEALAFHEAEKKVIGCTHAQVGAWLARRWQLPEVLTEAIRRHHSLNLAPEREAVTLAVKTADQLVHAGGAAVSLAGQDIQGFFGTQLASASQWYPGLEEQIGLACRFFLEGTP